MLKESPRWLYTRGKQTEAKRILSKYHGCGNEDSIWVSMQVREYDIYLNMDGGDKRWWDYKSLFMSRSARYRLACNCVVSVFAQWAGNGAVDYFISGVLESAGVTSEIKQMNINLGKSCMQLTFVSFLASNMVSILIRYNRLSLVLRSLTSSAAGPC